VTSKFMREAHVAAVVNTSLPFAYFALFDLASMERQSVYFWSGCRELEA
jgi:hypothetical protein